MASLVTEPNGRRMIQFKAPDGRRPKIRIGMMGEEEAIKTKGHIEHLASCWAKREAPLPATDQWRSSLLSDASKLWLYDRLAAAGLVAQRERPAKTPSKPKKAKTDGKGTPETLKAFLDAYIGGRSDVKEGTQNNLRYSAAYLVERFGERRRLADISPGDADDYRLWLRGEDNNLAEATVRRYCGRARQFFRAAVRKRLIAENPFGDMEELNVRKNKAREFFITREASQKVLAVMVDAENKPVIEWQLAFALARFGALRCPSELARMVWGDIDFEHAQFTVHSPKTERHEGKDSRVVPIFPELRPYLEAAFESAHDRLGRPPSGADPVFVELLPRGARTNLRTQFLRFLKRAGVAPWPKVFQNLRASRATELAASFPAYMAAAWCGHTEEVAKEHYWQITDADWQRAASQLTGEPVCNPGHETGANGTGNPYQTCSTHAPEKQENPGKSRVFATIQLPGEETNTAEIIGENAEVRNPGHQPGAFSAWRERLEAILDACPRQLGSVREAILGLAAATPENLEAGTATSKRLAGG